MEEIEGRTSGSSGIVRYLGAVTYTDVRMVGTVTVNCESGNVIIPDFQKVLSFAQGDFSDLKLLRIKLCKNCHKNEITHKR